jgi:hypothetical protein
VHHQHQSDCALIVQDWVTEVLEEMGADEEDRTIMVSQVRCFDPDCVPLETVIGVLGSFLESFN